MCGTKDSTPSTDFVLGAISSVHLLTQVHVGCITPRSCYQPSGQILEALRSGWGCDSACSLGIGKLGIRAGKTPLGI